MGEKWTSLDEYIEGLIKAGKPINCSEITNLFSVPGLGGQERIEAKYKAILMRLLDEEAKPKGWKTKDSDTARDVSDSCVHAEQKNDPR